MHRVESGAGWNGWNAIDGQVNLWSGRWQYKREKEGSIETDIMQEGVACAKLDARRWMTGKSEGVS